MLKLFVHLGVLYFYLLNQATYSRNCTEERDLKAN